MISPGIYYHPAKLLTGTKSGLHLRRPFCSESLRILSPNTGFSITLTLSLPLKNLPSINSANSLARGFDTVRTFRSGIASMGDSLKTDGLSTPNGPAVSATPSSLAHYSFPQSRLKTLSDSKKIPVILMACGSLSVAELRSKLEIF